MLSQELLDKCKISRVLKIKRKPVELEAMQYTGNNIVELSRNMHIGMLRTSPRGLFLQTIQGTVKVELNDYIVKDEQGFYMCVSPKELEIFYEIIH